MLCWWWWCADAVGALMLQMNWCYWCADAVDALILLMRGCYWCADADVLIRWRRWYADDEKKDGWAQGPNCPGSNCREPLNHLNGFLYWVLLNSLQGHEQLNFEHIELLEQLKHLYQRGAREFGRTEVWAERCCQKKKKVRVSSYLSQPLDLSILRATRIACQPGARPHWDFLQRWTLKVSLKLQWHD